MKAVFLDIDGPIVPFSSKSNAFDRNCVNRLNEITEISGAVIILTSSWRNLVHDGAMTLFGLRKMFQACGVAAQVLDITRPDNDSLELEGEQEPRWHQIAGWLQAHARQAAVGMGDHLDHYAILDNDAGAFGGRPGVLVNGQIGLTALDVKQALTILCP